MNNILEAEIDRDVLDAAIEAVYRNTGIQLKAAPGKKKGDRTIDAEITIEGYKKIRFAAEIKKWAQQANFGAIVNQVKQLPGKGMLVADYVDPKMADRLRELEIPYIDTVGNIFIDEKPLYILVKITRGQASRYYETQGILPAKAKGQAFNPTGLKVLYLFLTDQKMLNAPYREIAARANVALGTVSKVIDDLKQGGFLIDVNPKERRLTRIRKLLDKWCQAYVEKLRPKLAVGTFTAENPLWWRKLEKDITHYGARFGGEVAVYEMAGYLTPEEVIIYLENGDGAELFKQQRFRKDPKGNIHVYKAFWNKKEAGENGNPNLVDPIIVYADLIGSGDIRNIDAAEELMGEEGLDGLILEYCPRHRRITHPDTSNLGRDGAELSCCRCHGKGPRDALRIQCADSSRDQGSGFCYPNSRLGNV